MLECRKDRDSAYVFNIINDPSMTHYIFINALGDELHLQTDEPKYYWDCRQHDSSLKSICILQYTVSGEGVLEIGNKTYRQKPGDFFLIERPGPYRYWIPEDSEKWEIRFFEFSEAAMPIWQSIIQSFGRSFTMSNDGTLIKLWDKIMAETKAGQIKDSFKNIQYAYKMLLTLHQHLTKLGSVHPNMEAVQLCIQFIEKNYAENISLENIAAAGNLSPFYINKIFKSVTGSTPIRYLTKMRIRYGMYLLCDTELTIDEIARQCGFQNANYFAKVFRKYVRITPTDFRKQKMSPIIL